jgi:putative phosphoesterase
MLRPFTAKDKYLVGVISDTHGRLPQPVLKVFQDTDLIIHAGDIGKQGLLESLGRIAPTIGVRVNMDMDPWARHLPAQETVKVGKIMLWVIHDVYKIELSPHSNTYQIVISGHTHCPQVEKQPQVLFLNPGSAVQPRYGYPASVALLRIKGKSVEAQLIELKESG